MPADETVTLLVHGLDPASPRLAEILASIEAEVKPLDVELMNPLAVQLPPGVAPPPELASLYADDGRGLLLVASSAKVASGFRKRRWRPSAPSGDSTGLIMNNI